MLRQKLARVRTVSYDAGVRARLLGRLSRETSEIRGLIVSAACALAIVTGFVLVAEHRDRVQSDRATLTAIMGSPGEGLNYTPPGSIRH